MTKLRVPARDYQAGLKALIQAHVNVVVEHVNGLIGILDDLRASGREPAAEELECIEILLESEMNETMEVLAGRGLNEQVAILHALRQGLVARLPPAVQARCCPCKCGVCGKHLTED